MTTAGYDCKVAFTGYGETDSFNSGWFTSADEAQDYIWGITDYKSLTNISLGLAEAQKLVEGNTGRNTAVILISDGTPHKGNQDFPSDMAYYGYAQAEAIKAAGADIYGVLHAITGGVITDKAEEVMTTICGEGNYFTAYDTEGFSQAINDAISVSYGEFVLTDTVDPALDVYKRQAGNETNTVPRTARRSILPMIKITTDSTCDLPRSLLEQHDITVIPLGIVKAGRLYQDGVDIRIEDIAAHVDAGGDITTTNAVNIADYEDVFRRMTERYDAVIHINIGMQFSSCHQNTKLAAEEVPEVYVVDLSLIHI